jgi:photosystem II stability/assembly factor-like uncharacterized protein
VSRTLDGGDSWIHTFLATDADLKAIYFLNQKEGWVGGGIAARGCVWRTKDGGATWNRLARIDYGRKGEHGIPESIEGLVFRDQNEGWAVTHGKTMEPDPDWRKIGSPLEYCRVLHTKDAGITWDPVYYGGGPLSGIVRRGNVLIAVGGTIVRSEDGADWKEACVGGRRVSVGGSSPSVAFVDENRVLAIGNGFVVSDDAGETWEYPRQSSGGSCVVFGNAAAGWMGSWRDDRAVLLSTTDGGRTWRTCNLHGVPATWWRGMTAVDASHAWAVSRWDIARVRKPAPGPQTPDVK